MYAGQGRNFTPLLREMSADSGRPQATPTKPATTTEAFDKVVMKTYGRFSLTVSHGKG